ncbi:MAG: UDP-N-acetylmuramoyl-L-alanyl-D-glutamate--2,6-diaminopimelate ligase [Mariprofundaceae bacterium]|nr:UDP-N-acetylmuramoyl-L-alanyl-D-glutamate--2,6-diaminopimelate ligase [Mariprofundaceae bacterium]
MNKAQQHLQPCSQRAKRSLGAFWPDADTALHDIEISDVQDDSRLLQPGDAWLCLPAALAAWDEYADMAVCAGASLCIQVGGTAHVRDDFPVLYMADMAQLGRWLRHWFQTLESSTQLIAVTGTDGKTSVAWMTRSVLEKTAGACWSAGTLGWMQERDSCLPLGNTTASLLNNHRLWAAATDAHIPYVVMEVSSHGIDQERVAGLDFCAVVWTTMGRDHLDYHADLEAYQQSKARFVAAVGAAGGTVIANADQADIVRLRGHDSTHWYAAQHKKNEYDALTWQTVAPDGLCLHHDGQTVTPSPVPTGVIHGQNLAALATLLVHALGYDLKRVAEALTAVDTPPGRMESLTDTAGRQVFIDYAHTPEAMAACLAAARSAARSAARGRVLLVFGCGGERDQGKRALMGRAALAADAVWVTSDNPRNEDPEMIVDDIYPASYCADVKHVSFEIDRAQAIRQAVASLHRGDVLLIAGKGHEDYMELAYGRRIPWSDKALAASALAVLGGCLTIEESTAETLDLDRFPHDVR